MSKVIGPPQSGRVGNVVYRVTRTGLVASQFVVPRNPQRPKQQLGRAKFGMVSGHWLRTRQHIDGWTDSPIMTRAIVRPG